MAATTTASPRLKQRFESDLKPQLQNELGLTNVMQVFVTELLVSLRSTGPIEAVRRVGNPVLVGIDPRPEDLPPGFLAKFSPGRPGAASALAAFGKAVVDVVASQVAAIKLQAA